MTSTRLKEPRRIFKGTSERIPFTIAVDGFDGYRSIEVTIEGSLDQHGDRASMVLYLTVQRDVTWRRRVRDALSDAHQAVWQTQGQLHHNAKLTDAVSDAFQLGLYEEVNDVDA